MRRQAAFAALLTACLPLLTLFASPGATADAADGFALAAFGEIWAAADQAVAAGQAQRTWMWGPGPASGPVYEAYAEAPAGQRLVQYFDKSRMEDNAWRGGDDPLWRVTNGLLVVELVTGRMQTGDGSWEERAPAAVSVAGDPGSGPTYGDLGATLAAPPLPTGSTVTGHLLPGGQVAEITPPEPVHVGDPAPGTGHTIATPLWEYMTGPGAVQGNPFFATGYPVTRPYWVQVTVAGQSRWVLLQGFERRVLTYTPGNPPGFVVEMGNIGRHYYEWRYGHPPAAPTEPGDGLQPALVTIPESLRPLVADETPRLLNRTLLMPPGFSISLYAVTSPTRFMDFSPDGVLYAAQHAAGRVVAFPDRNHDGVADEQVTVVSGLNRPHSLVFHQGALYVAESHRVLRLVDHTGDFVADELAEVVPDLPNGGQHFTRTVSFGPDGKLYVSVGSSCNVCEESDWRRATILQFDPDGRNGRVYARGLRNSVGLAWQPSTGRLYATENGRDRIGDDVPPEEVNEIRDGGDYGWPRCHGADIPDPTYGKDPAACQGQIAPAVLMQAHSAPLGLAFVTSPSFPASYQGDLIVAFHGSWNRTEPTGYKLVRLPFRDGQPTGEVLDFGVGFRTPEGAWSRPVGVTFGPDGALYVSDDRTGAIYRIVYNVSGP